jgi:hypothetical protein
LDAIEVRDDRANARIDAAPGSAASRAIRAVLAAVDPARDALEN